MKKCYKLKSCLFVGALLATVVAFGQEITKYEKVYYTPQTIEESDYKLEFMNAVSTVEYNKLGVKIHNNTPDFMMIKLEESTFKFPSGDAKPDKNGVSFIRSGQGKTKTYRAMGPNLRLKEYTLSFGGLYKIPAEGNAVSGADFQLPPTANNTTVGPFKLKVAKWGATTKEAKIIFECSYHGNDVGLVDPSLISIKGTSKSGQEIVYANDGKKTSLRAMTKGDKFKFTCIYHIPGKILDMQFATMYLVWNDAFIESTPVLLETRDVKIQMDDALTEEKK